MDVFKILFFIFVFIILFKKYASDKIKYNVKYFLMFFCTLLNSGVMWPFCLFRPRDVRNAALFVWLGGQYLTWIINVKFHLRNPEILAEDRGAVVVANHQSVVDIIAISTTWRIAHKMTVVAKKMLIYIFPFNLMAYLCGVIFIDRKQGNKALPFEQTTSAIVNNKTKVWVFPEGTRNSQFPTLLPFKKGAFNMAVAAQAPIIPIIISPYYFINHKTCMFKKGHIIMECLEPIPTTGLTFEDVPELTTRVQNIMQKEFERLSKEVLDSLPPGYPHTYYVQNK